MNGNQVILDEVRSFAAPEGLFQIPRVERGEEEFEVTIPEGLQLSLVDVALEEASVLAGAEIEAEPMRGATGRARIRVSWSHPVPAGSLRFRLRAYASPDGQPPAPVVELTEPASHKRMRRLVEKDAPVDMAVSGPLAETFHRHVLERGGSDQSSHRGHLARALVEPATIITVSVVIAVIIAVCIALGFATFGAVLIVAMQKGYNIDDAGYQVAVGEGETRQEHKMMFNIRKP